MSKQKIFTVLIVSATLLLIVVFSTQKYTAISENAQEIQSLSPELSDISQIGNKFKKQTITSTQNCPAYNKAIKVDNLNRANFISKKAIQWYFNGYDKYKIAETLAATFGYSAAIQWVKTINGISRNHEQYTLFIQKIDALSYASQFSKKNDYAKELSIHKMNVYQPDSNYQDLFNQYPDLAINHWNNRLRNAINNINIEEALYAISELKINMEDPRFFDHPIKDSMAMYQISTYSEQSASEIINALINLSPVYVDDKNRLNEVFIPMLIGLNIDKKLWHFEFFNNKSFELDTTINKLIKNLEKHYPLLNKRPSMGNICSAEKMLSEPKKIKTVKLSNTKERKILSPVWDGIQLMLCPKITFPQNILTINQKLQKNGLSIDKLQSFDDILKSSENLKNSLNSFNENERSVLFSLLYISTKFQPEQIEILIKNGVTPKNSNFFFLIRNLPFEQQKQLITKYKYDLSHFNFSDSSMIANAIMYGSNERFLPFLIEQGFPLKQSLSSIDPLWLQLMLLSENQDFSINNIANLINLTELNETHVNIMYKIKQEDINIYNHLITQFPELEFSPPNQLIEISCH